MSAGTTLCTVALLLAMAACSPTAPDVPDGAGDLPPAENRPRTDERADERHRMVAEQIEAKGIEDPAVLEAMRNVPRHWFVSEDFAPDAYRDGPLPIAARQTISQPYIVALMTEALELQPDHRVLEIGTGSGYQAAVLSELTPHVFSIEIVPELARSSREVFDRHGYTTITSKEGDGYVGWPEHAPFDAIIVTAAPDHIPRPLVDQVKVGGHLVLPKGPEGYQSLVLLTKREDGRMTQRVLAPVRFVPMTGEAQSPDR
ncbi:MAG: protein-L-isoaspartate(D-aspartate) O-methyltransferase [Planctomycetota bacterium]|jgi:protein-L-isoaspartate(D-aspartate) O-methyltransferase